MKICKKCGSDEFYSNSDCKFCAIERARKWALKNKEKVKIIKEKYRKENKEKIYMAAAIYRKNNSEKIKNYYEFNKEKIKAKSRAWYLENREKAISYSCAYAKKNPNIVNVRTAKWALANKDRIAKKNKEWKNNNKAKVNVQTQNYRAKKRRSGGKLSQGIMERLFTIQRGKCACCNLPLGNDFHLDHIIPLALGGRNEDLNIQLLRATCNLQKSKKHPIDYMQSKGFLL